MPFGGVTGRVTLNTRVWVLGHGPQVAHDNHSPAQSSACEAVVVDVVVVDAVVLDEVVVEVDEVDC